MDTVIESGAPAPEFELPDLDGNLHRITDQLGRILILNFWSAECPWAKRADDATLAYLADWGEDVQLWSIASNANEPPELLAGVSTQRGLPVILHDAHQEVADLYGARTTPHYFVIDTTGLLKYQGALNDVTFRQRNATQNYLYVAVEALLSGRDPDPASTPPYGCTVVRFSE